MPSTNRKQAAVSYCHGIGLGKERIHLVGVDARWQEQNSEGGSGA